MESTNENTKKEHEGGEIPTEKRRSPVICVIASGVDLGAVARTLLRVNEHGFSAFVVVPGSDDSRVGTLAERLDAYVLELDASDYEPPFETVERVAQAFDFPGLVYFDAADAGIDFPRLEEQFEAADDYGVEAPVIEDRSAETSHSIAAIPAYNEADTIGSMVEEARQYVDEMLVVDDGSTDDTVAVAEQAGATVIEHGTNRGYGAALKTSFSEACDRSADVLVTLDGDGQHDPSDVPKLVEAVEETDANLVIGSRFHSEGNHHVPRYRRVGLFVINVLTNLSLGRSQVRSWVSDTQSGLRAFDEQAIASLADDDTLSDNMSATTDILYHARRNGYDVEEVGVTIYYEGEKTSTQNPLFHGLSVVSNILRTVERERPLTFIGLPGVVTALFGFGFGYWAFINYVQSGTFPTGLVLFCIFMTVFGSLLALTGVILHSIKTHIDALLEQSTKG
jgi:glycosyltransferase involved in cell wall biosynthesis